MKLHEAQEKHRNSVKLSPCLVCGKTPETGFYGRWADGGTCSAKCERIQQGKEKAYVDNDGKRHEW